MERIGFMWDFLFFFCMFMMLEIWFIINYLFVCVMKIKIFGKKFMKIKINCDNNLIIL